MPADEIDDIRRVRSFCRFCSALCGIVVTVDGDQVTEVRGDAEHPLSRGYTCPKGRALGAWHHHPQRLDTPMMGRGDQRRGADWETALGDLAEKIKTITAAHGPDAVGVYMATATSFDAAGGRMAFRLFQALGTRSRYSAVTIDTPCRPLVVDLLSGNPGLMPCIDETTAGLTVLVGTNPVVSHGHTTSLPDPVNRLRALAASPRELWVIDPRRSESARLATRHLAPRPSSDYAIFAFAIRSLLRGGADHAYLDAHTSADDVDALRAAVEPFDIDRAVSDTGLDSSELEDFVAALRQHRRVGAITGTGTTMSATANATEWLVWALQIITGSYEQPGGLWFHPGFLRCFDRRTLRPSGPEPVAWPRPPSRPDLPGFYGEYPCAALVDEIESGNLRALFVIGGNPANSLPDTPRVAAALARLEVLAVADVIETDTTAQATHLLPCAGQLERADVPDYVDQYYPLVASQHTAAVVAPGADRRPLWWIATRLGEHLGHRLLPGTLDATTATDDDLLDAFCGRGRLPLDELRAAPTAIVAEGPVRGWVHTNALPDGKWRLAPRVLIDDLARVAALDAASDINATNELTLLPRRLLRTLNSQLRGVAAPGGRLDAPVLLLHPDDAITRGITEASQVQLSSPSGSVTVTAQLDDGIRRGSVSLPHGFAEPAVGTVTTGQVDTDPLTGMVHQSGLRVRVTPIVNP
ncbi:MAG: molybdopterin-dependent oxidoreductase [Acidimicrobiales bacterium]